MFPKTFTTAALFAALVSAHTAVDEVEIGGKSYKGFYGASKAECSSQSPAWCTNQGWGYQPIMGDAINTPDIIAHKDASPSKFTAKAPAGSTVTFKWHHKGECQAGEVGWDCSHHGWTATYLAPCNGDCSKVDKTQLKFFKIHQSSLISYPEGTRYANAGPKESTGYWGTDEIFYKNGNKQTVTIPKAIPSGNYVLRTEVASIHNNGDVKNRQFWPQAFNIEVTGGSGSSVPEGKLGTELYKSNDELLKWDLYWHEADKLIEDAPGPKIAAVAITSKRSHARDFTA
ncbi:glycoside hydrolase [Delitschia confertaspora ATCC 74209]|uniref:Glycoside hydrolase n=1 Tax=Delitschia confertaspora ATCC 74209 TaxID=1513339 RepID=A0A9P4JPH7_9PLEO|nr:glycoside hydrolase [Delitschia confertaspora ATCC 74209]